MRNTFRRILSALLCILLIASACTTAFAVNLAGGTTMGKAAKMSKFGTPYVGRLISSRKVLWYKFKTANYDAFYDITGKNLSVAGWINIHLLDSNEEDLGGTRYMGKNDVFHRNFKLKKNRWYYLRVMNDDNATGNVKLIVTCTKDVVGDTRGKAKQIQWKKAYFGTMDGEKDVDYLKFKAPKTREYTFYLKNVTVNSYITTHVTNSDEEELTMDRYMNANEERVRKIKLRKGQWYFVDIITDGGTGKYKVLIK